MTGDPIMPSCSPTVIVPYMLALQGGTSMVLESGLPILSHRERVAVEYLPLARAEEHVCRLRSAGIKIRMSRAGNGTGILTKSQGKRRWLDLAKSAPTMFNVICSMRSAIRDADVVYTHSTRDLIFSVVASMACRRRAILLWHCHALHEHVSKPVAWFANRADHIVCVSQDVKKRLQRAGVSTDSTVVYNAPSFPTSETLQAKHPMATGRAFRALIMTGSMQRFKGIHVAIEALSRTQNVELEILGRRGVKAYCEYESELEYLIHELGIAERVRFSGFVADVRPSLERADVVLIPSFREAFPLAALEAVFSGKPVIASAVGGLKEIVEDGVTGLLVPAGDATALAAAIERLQYDPEGRERIAGEAFKSAHARFSLENWASGVEGVIHELIRKRADVAAAA